MVHASTSREHVQCSCVEPACITYTGYAATAEVLQHLCVTIAPLLHASLQLTFSVTDVMISPLLDARLTCFFSACCWEPMIYKMHRALQVKTRQTHQTRQLDTYVCTSASTGLLCGINSYGIIRLSTRYRPSLENTLDILYLDIFLSNMGWHFPASALLHLKFMCRPPFLQFQIASGEKWRYNCSSSTVHATLAGGSAPDIQ